MFFCLSFRSFLTNSLFLKENTVFSNMNFLEAGKIDPLYRQRGIFVAWVHSIRRRGVVHSVSIEIDECQGNEVPGMSLIRRPRRVKPRRRAARCSFFPFSSGADTIFHRRSAPPTECAQEYLSGTPLTARSRRTSPGS